MIRTTNKMSKTQLQIFIILSRTEPKNCLKELKFGYLQNQGIKLVERLKLNSKTGSIFRIYPVLLRPSELVLRELSFWTKKRNDEPQKGIRDSVCGAKTRDS